ncbi:MAG: ATP-binding protein [Lachnospiraceae bacterium]|nr:ATP-binding protein [Lachnospiraceae bacterium]
MAICTIETLENDSREKMIIDLRADAEFVKESYPGSVNYPADELMAHTAQLPKDRPIYLMCYTGVSAAEMAEDLENLGFREVYGIEGGFRGYRKLMLQRYMAAQENPARKAQDVERSIIKKFKKEIWRKFTKAINEYEMIQDGDKIAVCISGGKDSMLLAKLFQELYRHGRHNFEVEYIVMNPGYNKLNEDTILENARMLGVPIHVFKTEIFNIVADEEESPCYLCARMRRGYLYAKAKELGCNKIALGHHFDDVIETILMGMLYGSQIQTMMPKLHSTNFPGMELIRPMYLIHEADIIHWMKYNGLHFIQCACRFTEAQASREEHEKDSKRAEVKALIKELAKINPYVPMNIFRSVENVNLSTVIQYKKDGVKHHFLETYDEGDASEA